MNGIRNVGISKPDCIVDEADGHSPGTDQTSEQQPPAYVPFGGIYRGLHAGKEEVEAHEETE